MTAGWRMEYGDAAAKMRSGVFSGKCAPSEALGAPGIV